MARLLELERFKGYPIPKDDPLRFYYWPVIGSLYRRRIDGCVALLERGERVLEIGYGSGTSFLELSARYENVYGLDTHDYGPAIAQIFRREGLHVALERGSVLDPPYPDGHFDAILAMSVLEHLRPEDQPRVMGQLRRLLRSGGVLVVGVPGDNWLMSVGFRLLGYDIRQHHFSGSRIVLQAASRVLTIERVVCQPLPVRFLS